MRMDIIEQANITKNVFLEGKEINILDFGDINKNNIVGKNSNVISTEFVRRSPDEAILNKYHISVDQYNNICNALQKNIRTVLY